MHFSQRCTTVHYGATSAKKSSLTTSETYVVFLTHCKLLCCQKVELHVPLRVLDHLFYANILHIPGHSSRTVNDIRHQRNAALKRRKMTSDIDNFNSVRVEKTVTRKSNMKTTGINSLYSRAEKETSKTPETSCQLFLRLEESSLACAQFAKYMISCMSTL